MRAESYEVPMIPALERAKTEKSWKREVSNVYEDAPITEFQENVGVSVAAKIPSPGEVSSAAGKVSPTWKLNVVEYIEPLPARSSALTRQ